ncbi:hypothetical protein ASG52_20795 [Methylobacterium sp. Leaf456]|uniref:calcium-binding protein n=1 Tax=Methylobacterium sp. Leaf456 TaxID=1736382 RepID=UPI0006F7076B|nr:calcium-binding protein [Methylobacterium sp. Leaf456]KQT58580.1 hypothetical protein ASG52_20795 [Methylobacterium sp. Leaf456]
MAVLRVPQDYETIQEATDAAKPGDTVVADATYSAQEYVAIKTDNLTVGADRAAQQITLDLQGDATHLTLSGDAPIAVYGSEKGSVIQGNAGANVIVARSSAADIIDGGDGDDVIITDDLIFESGGADQLLGGKGNDTFQMGGFSYDGAVIDGGDGIDTLQLGLLSNTTIKNVEILDGYGHRGTVAQYQLFSKFIDSETTLSKSKISIFIDGAGGTLDFSSSVTDGFAIALRPDAMTSGLTVTGSNNGDSFYGTKFDDKFYGGNGSDHFYTSGGTDDLIGNAGGDIFSIDIVESGAGRIDGGIGMDTVIVSGSLKGYTFSNVEVLEAFYAAGTLEQFNSFSHLETPMPSLDGISLQLFGSGGSIDFRSKIGKGDHLSANGSELTSGAAIVGSSARDMLIGSAFDDRLDGWTGSDQLTGNLGNDTFIVDNRGDRVFEAVGGGTDTVVAGVSYALQAGQEIELLRAGDDVGGAAINLAGNAFAQTIQGTFGANVLDGKGGADALYGYGGDDTYVVDNIGDRVFESVGGGNDTVLAVRSYTLQAGQEIETLSALAPLKTKALNLTGNEFAQTITGNDGANVLDGKGGADTLVGKGGNDTYLVDNWNDRVVEAKGGGQDTVIASGNYRLGTGQEIETLQLAASTGKAGYTLVGNTFDNAIVGNAGNNKIEGGLGDDLLTGGAGRDSFVFASALGSDNVDHITDFAHGSDTVRLAKSLFTALGAGHLTDDAFKDLGDAGAAVDADDRILYDHNTGDLSYDADGSGTAFTAIRFAVVDNHEKAHLDHADILIV